MKKNTLNSIPLIIEYMRPHSAVGYQKIRVGGDYDGGYICVNDFSNIKLAVSGGIFDDDRWEVEIAQNKKIPTLAFDPNVYKDISNLPYKFFAGKLKSFPRTKNSMLDMILLNYKESDVIGKFDIEGEEWQLLNFTTDDTLNKFRQIIVEFHLHSLETLTEHASVFEKMYKNFRVVHIHGNNCDKTYEFQNLTIPKVFEITFANVNYYNLEISNESFPTDLDMPNCPENNEIQLGTFSL
jgi:hypothetical protein